MLTNSDSLRRGLKRMSPEDGKIYVHIFTLVEKMGDLNEYSLPIKDLCEECEIKHDEELRYLKEQLNSFLSINFWMTCYPGTTESVHFIEDVLLNYKKGIMKFKINELMKSFIDFEKTNK